VSLPDGWVEIVFSEAFESVSDGGRRLPQSRYQKAGKFPVIDQGAELIGGYTDDASLLYDGQLPVIVFGDHTRRIKLISTPFVVGAQGVKLVLPRACWETAYAAYSLSHARIPNRGYSRHFQFLKKMRFRLPPLIEQRRIVAVIEEQFSRLDAGEEQLRRLQQRVRQWRRAITIAALTGRLTHRLLDEEPADVAIERALERSGTRRRFGGSSVPLDDALVARLPAHWVWSTIQDVAERVTVGHVGPMKHEYVPEGIPFLRSQNVRENEFAPGGLRYIRPAFHERLQKSRILPGDVLVVRSGTVGVSCVVPEWLGEANCADLVVVQRPIAINPHFLAYYVNAMTRGYVRSQTVGVALAHFNTRSVAQLPIPVPPLPEQERIVAGLQQYLSVIDAVSRAISLASGRSAQLRAAVLANAFRGQLVTHDPSDEPASELLERIGLDFGPAPSAGNASD
jgi:Type I restriction modification DNA specificity domain